MPQFSDDEDEDDEEEFGDNDDFLNQQADAGERSFLPDPMAQQAAAAHMQKIEEEEAETARRTLLAAGYKKDELDVMFATDAELVKYYQEQRRGSYAADNKEFQEEVDAAEPTDKEPEDDFDLEDTEARLYVPHQTQAQPAVAPETSETSKDPAPPAKSKARQGSKPPKKPAKKPPTKKKPKK